MPILAFGQHVGVGAGLDVHNAGVDEAMSVLVVDDSRRSPVRSRVGECTAVVSAGR